MARKRKLTAPSAEDLSRYEEEFRRETSLGGAMAPIAQVASEAAQTAPVQNAEERAQAARIAREAEAFRTSRDGGLLILEVPLGEIDPEDMVRDRASLDEDEMAELRLSITQSGLRLPIELYERADEAPGPRYGILSGYRRFKAVSGLLASTGEDRFARIKALVRTVPGVPDAFTAMVEENEVRSNLSPFERGRIASIAVRSGVFGSIDESVNRLFFSASKAKRSKIRSFALIFDELGDLMAFPEALTEKQGLQLAAALRAGSEAMVRRALADGAAATAEEEWSVLEPVIAAMGHLPRDTSRGGRPAGQKQASRNTSTLDRIDTEAGYRLVHQVDARGHVIRIEGMDVPRDRMHAILEEVLRILDAPA